MNPHRKFKNHGGGFDLVVVLILCFFIFTAFALSAVPHKNNISFCKNKRKYSTQMINKDFQKLLEIRKLLKEAYDHYFENDLDGSHKSQEGHIGLEFGNYWEDEKCELKITSVNIYSYVFGNSRSHYYDSLDEALEVVRQWHKVEMNTDYAEQRRLEAEYNERFPYGTTYIRDE